MPYIETRWISLAVFAGAIIHILANYIFYRVYLEVIEDFLSDIALVKIHRDFYGNSHLGRRMREMFIIFMIMTPSLYKNHEVIAPWKIQKVPPALRLGVKFNCYSALVLLATLAWVCYFRLRLGIR